MADLFVSGRIVTALEAAAVAVGRLDVALAGNPLRRGWTFWSELDAAPRRARGGHPAAAVLALLERTRRRPPPRRGRRSQGRSVPPRRPPPRPAAPARRHHVAAGTRPRDPQPELRGRAALLDGDPGSRTGAPARHRPRQPAGSGTRPAG